jgi:hypothetical protein
VHEKTPKEKEKKSRRDRKEKRDENLTEDLS